MDQPRHGPRKGVAGPDGTGVDQKPQAMRVALATLGCKVNQCESAALAEAIAARGVTLVPFTGEADCYIVNTCTVTGRTDGQSRQLIRRALRQNPAATVLVTGCYAQRAPEEVARIPGVRLVAGNAEKEAIPELLAALDARPPQILVGGVTRRDRFSGLDATGFPGHTRAFLKIQDGCDSRCSYCIVPGVRGPGRSLPPAEVRKRLERLAAQGFREVVLTGIHLGAYGRDLRPVTSLTDLVAGLVGHPAVERLRLSSIEPREVTDELIALIAQGKGLCRHLHIPLQSGDDAVLEAMNRNYDAGFYDALIGRIVRSVPGIAVGIDVIAGFPGETEAAFRNTLALLEALPAAYLHVFPYSRRPGTPAAAMAGQVAEETKRARTMRLRALGERKRRGFAESFLGLPLEVLTESRRDRATGHRLGLSDNYLPVAVRRGGAANRILRVRPDAWSDGRLLAEVIHG